jgi:hypothetical protein
MRKLLIGAALAALAAPAFADTLQEVIAKGVVMTVMGTAIPINYGADGKYAVDFQGQKIEGTWRIDADKLCTKSTLSPDENCTVYPSGKKSGDEFEVVSPTLGPIKVKIN